MPCKMQMFLEKLTIFGKLGRVSLYLNPHALSQFLGKWTNFFEFTMFLIFDDFPIFDMRHSLKINMHVAGILPSFKYITKPSSFPHFESKPFHLSVFFWRLSYILRNSSKMFHCFSVLGFGWNFSEFPIHYYIGSS